MTKTQLRVMKLFASRIADKFSLQGAGRELGMHQALSYRSGMALVRKGLIRKDGNGLFGLNYKENRQELVSVECQRASEFLAGHRRFALFAEEFISEVKEDSFIFLVFGSAVEKPRPRDYDILVIFDSVSKAETYEQVLMNLSESYPSLKVDVKTDSMKDFEEMLNDRDDPNVVNQALNRHILVYGAELFYRTLRRARPYDC